MKLYRSVESAVHTDEVIVQTNEGEAVKLVHMYCVFQKPVYRNVKKIPYLTTKVAIRHTSDA